MRLFESFDDELEISTSGKSIQLTSKIPIPCCWINVSDPIGKIVYKKIEKDLTETTISLNVKAGIYHVTIVTGKSFATKMIFLE